MITAEKAREQVRTEEKVDQEKITNVLTAAESEIHQACWNGKYSTSISVPENGKVRTGVLNTLIEAGFLVRASSERPNYLEILWEK